MVNIFSSKSRLELQRYNIFKGLSRVYNKKVGIIPYPYFPSQQSVNIIH